MPFFNSVKVLTNSYSLGSVSELFGKKLLSSSNEPGMLDRAMSKSSKDFEFSVERNFKKSESSGNGTLAFSVSDSNGGSTKEKTSIAHGLNQGVKKCSSQIIQEANDSLKSNYKLQQSPDFLDLDFMNKEAEVNGTLRSDSSFMLKSGSSISHNDSFCSSDQGQPETVPKIQTASCFAQSLKTTEAKTQSRNFQSMQTWLTSKNTQPSSISQSKVEEQLVQFCCSSEREDQVNILQDVDELKFELQRLFTKTADGNAASGFSIKVTHFKGKVPSEKHQSSIIPFPGEPRNTLYGNCKSCRERQILRMKHGGPQNVKHHCRPFLDGAPFVICSRCYKLLQLPADFLLSTKRVHRLRCGFCLEVLKYTFRPRTRSVPCIASLEHVICKDENTSPSGQACST